MLIINQLKLKPGYTDRELQAKVSACLKVLPEDILSIKIERRSIDARKKPDVFYVLSVVVVVKNEESVLRRIHNDQVSIYKPVRYVFPKHGDAELKTRPVIVGAGPCGLFAAYYLAASGFKPLVLERGFDVETRTRDINEFWNGGKLRLNSNVLFGEGGAGAFSDGKLNTLVKDKSGRNNEVLKLFVKYGADPSIEYDSKPHIGTDVLVGIIKRIREDIKAMGGEFRFNAELTDISFDNGRVKEITVNNFNKIPCEVLILAIGHSARDTFKLLYEKEMKLEQKDFAVGFRIEHRQSMINKALYSDDPEILRKLPPAAYKLTYKAENGRGVYSFCMCPGGYVVNASSEEGRLCVNGMSYSDRSGENANSAIVVTVGKDDFESSDPLAGIEFQRRLEEKAYKAGNGSIPVQFYKDFKADVNGTSDLKSLDLNDFFSVNPCTKGAYTMGSVSEILPEELNKTIIEGIEYFERIIPGFAGDYALLSGVEARTSSPVRITRDENFESLSHKGVYPGGEGAGYAGGIMSAAMDGIKLAEAICQKYYFGEKQ